MLVLANFNTIFAIDFLLKNLKLKKTLDFSSKISIMFYSKILCNHLNTWKFQLYYILMKYLSWYEIWILLQFLYLSIWFIFFLTVDCMTNSSLCDLMNKSGKIILFNLSTQTSWTYLNIIKSQCTNMFTSFLIYDYTWFWILRNTYF